MLYFWSLYWPPLGGIFQGKLKRERRYQGRAIKPVSSTLSMITNLFSAFDPAAGPWGISLNWGATLLGVGLIPYMYWRSPRRVAYVLNSALGAVYKELRLLLGPGAYRIILAFISLFTLIILNNCLGLVPYIFTRTSHMSISLRLSLPLWDQVCKYVLRVVNSPK